MLHPSIQPQYSSTVLVIQTALPNEQAHLPVTQSIIEIWKLVYSLFPKVVWSKVPDYPDYRRNLVEYLVAIEPLGDWNLIDDFDYEYFRVIEHFSNKSKGSHEIAIDLSFYNVNDGIYWKGIDPSRVLKEL